MNKCSYHEKVKKDLISYQTFNLNKYQIIRDLIQIQALNTLYEMYNTLKTLSELEFGN